MGELLVNNGETPETEYFRSLVWDELAAGLLILARLFFGFGHSNKWGGHSPYLSRDVRSKIKNMTPEEKKEFFSKMHYNREMWHSGCYDEKEQGAEEKGTE